MRNLIANIVPVLLATAPSTFAGDEQWDDRFGAINIWYPNAVAAFQGKPHVDNYRLEGTNLVEYASLTNWNTGRNGAAYGNIMSLVTDGHCLYALDCTGSVVRWDGTNAQAIGFGYGGCAYGIYYVCLALLGDELFVGGSFGEGYVEPRGCSVVRLSGTNNWTFPDGGLCSEMGDRQLVYAMTARGTELFAAGAIWSDYDIYTTYILARWDGTNWHRIPGPAPGKVYALAVSGNDLYIGGEAGQGILRWDGTNWHSLGSGLARAAGAYGPLVRSIAIRGNDVYVAGQFDTAGGLPANNIARWDGTNWHALGSGLQVTNPSPFNVAAAYGLAFNGDDLIVCGTFDTAGGKLSRRFAIWHTDPRPVLQASISGGMLHLSWSATATGYVLESSSSFSGGDWADVMPAPTVAGSHVVPASGAGQFYRLRKP